MMYAVYITFPLMNALLASPSETPTLPSETFCLLAITSAKYLHHPSRSHVQSPLQQCTRPDELAVSSMLRVGWKTLMLCTEAMSSCWIDASWMPDSAENT